VILRDSSKPILLPHITQHKELGSTDSEPDNESLLKDRTYIWESGKEFRKAVGLKYDTEQEVAICLHANDEHLWKRKTKFQERRSREDPTDKRNSGLLGSVHHIQPDSSRVSKLK
jgi:hypothetical protein